ncbi:hypothetical protein GXW83_27550 [Streptacidiphilus sp. PB12-B1b]|uniref:hypothetical protein n=1 Tax=Streptacidiphilus sp. PB12-B1b TaxID=2705012 RepID=UPI0015FB45C0|nr:hypothetical protein [Streptacidiphilus sp. PB12-B1b]QMU78901.1 hypothetical protein GXW83_27550 [Streptacidiphilus sp. PB12-B1b]
MVQRTIPDRSSAVRRAQGEGERYVAQLSDLCSGSFHAVHPEVRAHFPVAALDYASNPSRNVAVLPIPPGDGSGLRWVDTGDIGIVGAYDPALMTRAQALDVIERQSGKALRDVTPADLAVTL